MTRSRNDAILDVIALVHEIDAGRVRLPRPGAGPPRVDGRIVVPRVVHRVFCGSRTVARVDPVEGWPPLVECHGCGLLHPAEERVEEPAPTTTDVPPCSVDVGARVVRLPRPRRAR